jgi:hypothetical protein
MATLKVIPFPPPANTITQNELAEFIVLRRDAREARARFEAREKDLIERLRNGAAVQAGVVGTARLEPTYTREVSWKTVAIRLARRLGYDAYSYVENVTKNTKGTVVASLYVGE